MDAIYKPHFIHGPKRESHISFYEFKQMHEAQPSAHRMPIDMLARIILSAWLSMNFDHVIYGFDRSPAAILKRQLRARASQR